MIIKKYSFIYILLIMLLFPLTVNASMCSYSEQAKLNSEVSTIKVIYEPKTGTLDPSEYVCPGGMPDDCTVEYNYFTISLLNLSPNFYVKVKNTVNKNIYTLYYEDVKDGVVSFDAEDISEVTTYTFTAYTTANTGCSGEKFRSFYLTTPRYNSYSNYDACKANPEFYLCEKYVTFTDIDYYEFEEKMDAYQEDKKQDDIKQNRNFFLKVLDFIKEYKWFFLTAIAGALVITIVTVIIVKKQRKKRVL